MNNIVNSTNVFRLVKLFILYRIFRIFFPSKVVDVNGKWILVTGAAGGLGREICMQAVGKGAKVIMWDIQQQGLESVAADIKQKYPNAEIRIQVCNLASKDKLYETCDETLRDVVPDVVVNNAGVISGGSPLLESDDKRNQLSFDVNVMSHFWITKKFLPKFLARGSGQFVNVSSMASFVAASGMVDYAASKFAARGFAQGLSAELKQLGAPAEVSVTCFCPSHIDTKLFQGFSITGNFVMSPQYVAERLIESIECRTELVVLPRYLIPSLNLLSLAQMLGFHGLPNIDRDSPMAKWNPEQANKTFELMQAKTN